MMTRQRWWEEIIYRKNSEIAYSFLLTLRFVYCRFPTGKKVCGGNFRIIGLYRYKDNDETFPWVTKINVFI
jgi:hypothetical protein